MIKKIILLTLLSSFQNIFGQEIRSDCIDNGVGFEQYVFIDDKVTSSEASAFCKNLEGDSAGITIPNRQQYDNVKNFMTESNIDFTVWLNLERDDSLTPKPRDFKSRENIQFEEGFADTVSENPWLTSNPSFTFFAEIEECVIMRSLSEEFLWNDVFCNSRLRNILCIINNCTLELTVSPTILPTSPPTKTNPQITFSPTSSPSLLPTSGFTNSKETQVEVQNYKLTKIQIICSGTFVFFLLTLTVSFYLYKKLNRLLNKVNILLNELKFN